MTNSTAVIAEFCGEHKKNVTVVTFPGVEQQLHGIYMISCIFTSIVQWFSAAKRENSVMAGDWDEFLLEMR